jgi:hypothetical protein
MTTMEHDARDYEKAMNAVTKAALELLRSPDFFARLRGALARVGLAGE